MSAKSKEAQLNAIFNLKFYRQKKKWMFSHERPIAARDNVEQIIGARPESVQNQTLEMEVLETEELPFEKTLLNTKFDSSETLIPVDEDWFPPGCPPSEFIQKLTPVETESSSLDEAIGNSRYDSDNVHLARRMLTAETTSLDEHDDLSQNSLSEFIRGAQSAPHSTELELSLYESQLHETSADVSLTHMPTDMLRESLNSYMHALNGLLKEAERRNELILPSFCTYLNYEVKTPVTDDTDFVAGSYKNFAGFDIDEGGRGVGRLHREHIIGIAGGRPYRL